MGIAREYYLKYMSTTVQHLSVSRHLPFVVLWRADGDASKRAYASVQAEFPSHRFLCDNAGPAANLAIALADAEFGWMLEMWGYSIACAKQKIRHNLLEHLQIEPSSQFGLDLSRGGVYTHHVLHYTFAHHYSAEGVPMIDSRHGEWHLDKREWQRSYPIAFPRPPTCARESAQTLYRMLHSAASSLPKWTCPVGLAAARTTL